VDGGVTLTAPNFPFMADEFVQTYVKSAKL